jgi:hypothetical protein
VWEGLVVAGGVIAGVAAFVAGRRGARAATTPAATTR